MAKPALLVVDDDPEVLRALERDLQRQYGKQFRVLRADSNVVAMDTLQQIKLRNDSVGLLLVDQRLPQTTGVELLQQTIELFPRAKRVLMTGYAEINSAIRAINKAKIHHYLMKPWEPPEEHLYPILNDLLDDWQCSFRPPFEGIQLVGFRWSPQSHELKDFLSLNRIPYKWLDIEASQEACQLVASVDSGASQLPLVFFSDDSHLVRPTNIQVAEKIGLSTHAERPFYDLIIVGGGPAGLAASVYAASEGIRTMMIERKAPGGQAVTTSLIENYLGFPMGLSGLELTERAVDQAKRFGVEILTPQEVTGIRLANSCHVITLKDGSELSCHAVLIVTGVEWRQLNVPGINKLTGAGVYYGAAMTEALSCGDQAVYIVGGGNSAGQAAMYISKYASHVTILVRSGSLAESMSQYLIDQISATENIILRVRSSVVEVHGEKSLEAITIANAETGEKQTLPTTALFILIGAVPNTDWLEGSVERDDRGFILSGRELMRNGSRPQGWTLERDPLLLESSMPGIFVAGDVRQGSVKRVAGAVGEGAIAIHCIHQYLMNL